MTPIADASDTQHRTVALRRAGAADLALVNQIVDVAVSTWGLPARVRRLAGPSLRYTAYDLQHMDAVIAHDARGKPVGVAMAEPAGIGDAPAGLCALLLHGLYVLPARHGEGIGGRLVAWVTELAARRGRDGVEVRAWREAEDFFRSRGFQELRNEGSAGGYPRRLWLPS